MDVRKELEEKDYLVGTKEEYEEKVQERMKEIKRRNSNYFIDINI
jgi:hypothetical protein